MIFWFSGQACNEFHEVASVQGKRWQKLLSHEHEQRLKLEDMVEQLAKDQISLEKKARMTVKHDGKRGGKSTTRFHFWPVC